MKTLLRRAIARQLERRVKKLIKKNNLKIVAITGSVGKTSTKLAIAAVLGQKFRVLAHQGNYNTEIGLPLSIFELDVPENLTQPAEWLKILRQIDRRLGEPYPYDVLVLEMGADRPGEIQQFMRYIQPDVGVVTAIQQVHMEGFGSLTAIIREKTALASGSRQVVYNADDPRTVEEVQQIGGKLYSYGLKQGDFHFENFKRQAKGYSGALKWGKKSVKFKTELVGEHSLRIVAAAAAVAKLLGLTEKQLAEGIAKITPVPGRMQLLPGKRGSVIIDDTYNSSPKAVLCALETLKQSNGGRKIAILGSMNELGSYAEAGHQEVGKACSSIDMLLTIGENANKHLASAARGAGLDESKIHRFNSPYEAGRFLARKLKGGDTVLAKGSQNGVFAEEAVALLLSDQADKAKLVRQGEAWQARKQDQFPLK
ncbi:MAG TPA: UDP-N-acetylmuramoyl-tripeptide--D-alanyl-D-alanine ligase [Candidatus Dormibacteraeota bacterium]|nr:UDP-N-acetylmuramoyl-tripeptide--D-alanyl-D-alanine ligase [Candidatus Dormibacteraeota bacterium]